MTSRLTRRAALAALAMAPAACSRSTDFFDEVGVRDLDPEFGAATQRNMLIQMGEGEALAHLGGRFSAAVEDTVTFPFDSAALDGRARAILDRQAAFIRQFPEVRFSVTGHADAVGPEGYNQGLGLRRARAVVHYLRARGVDRARLVALSSDGERNLKVSTQGRSRANRRAVTTVQGFMAGHPRVLDGKYARIVYRTYVASAQ